MDFTLETLTKEAEELRGQLKDIEATIRVMKRLGGNKQTNLSSTTASRPSTTISASGKINLDELNVPTKTPRKSTLFSDIEALIDRFGDQEFTINHIEAALKQLGKSSNAKHFKNRIYVSVRKLMNDGVLILTHKGIGNEPHRYGIATKTENNVTKLPASTTKQDN